MSAADVYTGIVPDVYTALRATVFNTDRYLEFVRDVGQPALGLGCGDAGPFLELARRGIDIEGVDSSAEMLARCRTTADAEGLSIVTHRQAMEDLSLNRTLRAIYLAGPTFNLLPDDHTAMRALTTIARHLRSDGQALVPLWIPSPQQQRRSAGPGSPKPATERSPDTPSSRKTMTWQHGPAARIPDTS